MEAIRHGPGEIVNPSVSPTLAFGPEEKPKGGTSTVQATLLHSNTHGDREDDQMDTPLDGLQYARDRGNAAQIPR